MTDELDNQESLNPESDQDTNPETDEETAEEQSEDSDLEKAKQYGENQKIRAEKAEKELKKLKSEQPETPKNDGQSSDPDYAKLAYLEGKKVEHPDDQKIVMDEAERLKLPLTDILAMDHIQAKLKKAKDNRETQDGLPKGKGKAGGTGQRDVDYYLAKGTTPDDPELAEKVINARMKTEAQGNKFADELYTG